MRERQASSELRPGREPHWLGWSNPLEQAMADSQTAIICSSFFDTVFRRTIMRKDAGDT